MGNPDVWGVRETRLVEARRRVECPETVHAASESSREIDGVHVWMTLTVEPHLRCHTEAVSTQEDFVASEPPPDHSGSPNRLWPRQRPKEESRSWHTPLWLSKEYETGFRISIQRHHPAAVVTARTETLASSRVEGIAGSLLCGTRLWCVK